MDPQRPDDDQIHDRRGLLAATVAAVTLGAVTLTPRPASAQLDLFGGGAASAAQLAAIVEWLRRIWEALFGGGTHEIPPAVTGTTESMSEMLGRAGPDSYSRMASVPGAIARSYPEEAPATPVEQLSQAMLVADATRVRVQTALEACAWCSEAQRGMSAQEQGLVARAQDEEAVIAVLRAQTALLGATNQRLGHLVQVLTPIAELLGDQALRDAENRRQIALDRALRLQGAGQTIAPAMPRSAQ